MDNEEKEFLQFVDQGIAEIREDLALSSFRTNYFNEHPLNISWTQAQNIITTVKAIN